MTTFNPPSALTVNASGAYYIAGTQEYKRYSAHALDSATNVYYTLYNVNNTPAAGHAVYFDTSSLQWVDGNTGTSQWPAIIVQPSTLANDDSVEFKKTDGTVIYKFDMRGLVGANTNTNSNTLPFTASFINVSSHQFTWKVVHNIAAPSPVTYQLHSTTGAHATTVDPTFIEAFVVGASADNENSSIVQVKAHDTIEIRQMNGSVLASLKVGTTKKVHCNFW